MAALSRACEALLFSHSEPESIKSLISTYVTVVLLGRSNMVIRTFCHPDIGLAIVR